jgi:hypothetical protein
MSDDELERLRDWAKGRRSREGGRRAEPRRSRGAEEVPKTESDADHGLLREFEKAGPLEEHERVHRPPKRPSHAPRAQGRDRTTPGGRSKGSDADGSATAGSPRPGAGRARQTPSPPPKARFADDWVRISVLAPRHGTPSKRSLGRASWHTRSGRGPRLPFGWGSTWAPRASASPPSMKRRVGSGSSTLGRTKPGVPGSPFLRWWRWRRTSKSLVFGNEAVSVQSERKHTSFKAGLIYPDHPSRKRAAWRELGEAAEGLFAGTDGPGPEAFCYTLSLARAMELALPAVLSSPDGDPPEVFVSLAVGAPDRRGSGCHRRIEHATFAALRMAGAVGARPTLESAVRLFIWAWRAADADVAMGPEEKRVDVVPEVVASLRALQDGFASGENLLVADIGATTTEMAVLRYHASCIHLWDGRSHGVGVDHRAGEQVEARDLIGVRRERAARSASGRSRTWAGFDGVCADLADAAKRTILSGIRLNPDRTSWADLSVFVVGGGSNIPPLRQAVATGWRPNGPRGDQLSWVQRAGLRTVASQNAEAVGATHAPPDTRELAEVVAVMGITRPPWTADEFSDKTLRPVRVTVEDPVQEFERGRRRGRGWV